MTKPKRCPCLCSGCTDPTTNAHHCLVDPCTRQRNRRSPKEIEAAGRYRNGRPRKSEWQKQREKLRAESKAAQQKSPEPKQTPLRPTRRRLRYIVRACRNGKKVSIPAWEGRDEAMAMAIRLKRSGWTDFDGQGEPSVVDLTASSSE